MTKTHLKKEIIITLRSDLPSLNNYIKQDRTNRFVGAKMKREATDSVFWETKEQIPKNWVTLISQAHFHFIWHCPNMKEDPDNIAFKKKYILDGFQLAGLISNDGWKNVLGFEDEFDVDNKDPRVEIIIKY